jgi:hypothetical protein
MVTQEPVWNIGSVFTQQEPSGALTRWEEKQALFTNARWVSSTPFGRPVVPEVNWI